MTVYVFVFVCVHVCVFPRWCVCACASVFVTRRHCWQVVPKGGWFQRLYPAFDEHRIRIVRAHLLSRMPTNLLSGSNQLVSAFEDDQVPQDVFHLIEAVCRGVFAEVAAHAHGANGRARATPARLKSPEDWAHSVEWTVPRYHVVHVSTAAMGFTATENLATGRSLGCDKANNEDVYVLLQASIQVTFYFHVYTLHSCLQKCRLICNRRTTGMLSNTSFIPRASLSTVTGGLPTRSCWKCPMDL